MLTAGIVYTVSCNVAKPSYDTGAYIIELVALNQGDPRNTYNRGTVLTATSGTATQSNMSEEVSFQYSTDASNPNIGRLLAVRIRTSRCLVDNLVFEDDTTGGDVYPPALWHRYPLNNSTTMATNYPLLMVFNEEVTNGTGNIVVRLASNDSIVETIDVASDQVTISSNEVTVTRSQALALDTAYYVTIADTAFVDMATNAYPGISSSDGWAFSTPIPDGSNMIFTSSFESPTVTGRETTEPSGWVLPTDYGTGRTGMANTNYGTFTTPFGAQAAAFWNDSRSVLTTAEETFSDTLVSGVVYTVTYNVASGEDLSYPSALASFYRVQLVAFDAGSPRGYQHGTVLKQQTGVATISDLVAQSAGFTFTAGPSHAEQLGRQLAVRINNDTVPMLVVDNVRFSDDTDGSDIAPPALSYRYPRDNQTTMTVDYPLLLTFNEEVVKGTGNIVVHLASDDSIVESIDVTSGQVVIASNEVTVTRSQVLKRGMNYYVAIDNAAFADLAANYYPGISDKTDWSFYTPVPDGSEVIYATSFEGPVVSNRTATAPTGWARPPKGSYGTGDDALENEITGTFSTPYGSQAAVVASTRTVLSTESNTIEHVLVAGWPYTLSCNVAKCTNLNGGYRADLVAYDPGEERVEDTQGASLGTTLARITGTAILSDMAAAADAVTFMAEPNDPSLGKPLGIRVWGEGCIDNLKLTWVPPPPAGSVLIVR